MGTIEFRCWDKDGILVTCSKKQWRHIEEHKELRNKQAVVKHIINKPDTVTKDRHYKHRRNSYKQLVLPYVGSTYVKVVIEYRRQLLGRYKGSVKSAYACDGILEGEEIIWERKAN